MGNQKPRSQETEQSAGLTLATYADLIEHVGDAVIASDQNFVTTAWNRAAERMYGWTAEEVMGKPTVEYLQPEFVGVEPSEVFRRLLEEGHFEGQVIHPRKDGTKIYTEARAMALRGEDGNIAGFVSIDRDITERLNIERLKDEFLRTVSHELRTPVTAIHASVMLAASGAVGDMPPQAQRVLEIAVANTGRLSRLITDVFDLERLEAGRLEMQAHECDAEWLLRQAVLSVDALMRDANIHVLIQATDAHFIGDSDRIIQVLTNLIENAIKFSPEGSTVVVKAGFDGGQVRFDVADEGLGIPEDQIDRIFDRFVQLDSSDSRNRGGAGLGLAISQRIVAEHGGRIWATSALGQGSTFSFVLPSAPA